MRILLLHQYYATLDSSTGTRWFEFSKRLVAAGHEVRIITSSAYLPHDREHNKTLFRRTMIDGIPSVVLGVSYANAMSFDRRKAAFLAFATLASFFAVREPADVILATSTPLTIAIPALIAKHLRRLPMIFEIRDLWPDMAIVAGGLSNPLQRRFASWLERAAYRGASHVVALSPAMAKAVVERGKTRARTNMIPNGCDLELFAAAVPMDVSRFGLHLAPDQPLVVYAGAVGPINGLDYLLRLAAEMRHTAPQVRFLIVGDGGEWQRLRNSAQDLGILNHNLYLSPSIPKREVPSLLAAASMATSIFQPLRGVENNSANKFFDSLAAGKPVAINYGGWQAELLDETQAGITLSPGDPACGAHQLACFLGDTEKLNNAARASRQLAQRFDRDLLAAQLQEILLSAVAHSGRSHKAGARLQ